MKPPPLRPDAPLPDSVSWPHALRPPTIQDCLAYHQIILQVNGDADARASTATREYLRLRAVSEAESAKALVPAATEATATGTVEKKQKQKPGWFRRLFGGG
jgi:regulator of protease activity HflC (stomatin/prohibitin superfamily)